MGFHLPWQKSDEEKLAEAKKQAEICDMLYNNDPNCRNLRNYTQALMKIKSLEKKIKEKE